MTKALNACLLAMTIVNAAALALFVLLFLLQPLDVDLAIRINFTQLDRAEAINQQALKTFDPSHKFGNIDALEYRETVPIFIAGPAIAQMQFLASIGILVTGLNSLGALTLWIWMRRNSRMHPGAEPQGVVRR